MADVSVGRIALDLDLNSSKFNKQVKNTVSATENAFAVPMKKIVGLVASAFAVGSVVNFSKTAIAEASKIQSAWTGLNSIVQGTGNSFTKAQSFINDYTKDGLTTVTEATTAYKNLLSRGYDTSQIENTMIALKDSAAFGRQANYDLGEAIVTATEGLKNENSILVDNAGVTKNVAKMWEDYAKTHNTTTSAMTQAQKIEAEYNGILEETKFQTGDATVYAKTFSGQMQMLTASFTNMKVAVGRVITPIAQLFIPVINSAINAITSFLNSIQKVMACFGLKFNDVVSKSSNNIADIGTSASESASEAVKASKKINKAFGSMDEINVLNTKDTSSSSTKGASGGGVDIPLTPTITSDATIETAVCGTMDKIMKYIEPLKYISFDNLLNAFDSLKDALGYFGKGVGAGLEGLYFNLLVPLAHYTITDALPHFLESTAKAINNIDFTKINGSFNSLWDALAPFAVNVGDGLLWLYDNVCIPLANFTINDILPSFLNLIGGAISFINQVVTNAQPVLDWLWNNLLLPIASWTGGVIVDVLTGVGNALMWISENEVALTILESLAIAIGLVSAALTIWNVATTVWNTVGAIGTAVTTAFGLAMSVLTSPITLVVLAITALIAIIILCIKHWNDIKEAASSCWQWICNTWNGAMEWFNNTVVQPIKNVFSSAWNSLKNGAVGAWNGIKSVFSSVATFFKNTFSNAWNGVKKIFSTGGKIFDGIKDGIVSAFTKVVNTIIKGINKVIKVPFDGINGALKKIKKIDILGIKPFSWMPTISTPQIPMLAQGGYVPSNSPQLAIIGDNTREGEIVSPESKIYDQVDKAIKDNKDDKETKEIRIILEVRYEDGRKIIKKINQEQIDAGEILLLT